MNVTKQSHKLTPKEKTKIVELYKNGLSTIKIGKIFGLNPSGIRALLNRRNISTSKLSCYRTYKVDKNFFKIIDTEEKAYILGFLYGDGNNYPEHGKISVTSLKKDERILKRIRAALKSNAKLYYQTNKKTKQVYVTLAIYSKEISKDLIHLGVIKNKTKFLQFPILPPELIKHFIRGLFDSDGCFTFGLYHTYNNYKYYMGRLSFCGTIDICKSIKAILKEAVQTANTQLTQDKRIKYNFRTVTYSSIEDINKIYHYFYDNSSIFLKRKRKKIEKFLSKRGVV